MDLVTTFGYPLPLTVIAELLGVPVTQREDFRRLSFIAVNGSTFPSETFIAAAREMVDFVRERSPGSGPTPTTTCSVPIPSVTAAPSTSRE